MNVLLVVETPGGGSKYNVIALVPSEKLIDIDSEVIDGKLLNADDLDDETSSAIVNLYKRMGLESQKEWTKEEIEKEREVDPDFTPPPILEVDLAQYVNPEPPFVVDKVIRFGWAV